MTIKIERGRLAQDWSSYMFTSQGVGAGTYTIAGGCLFSAADANLNQGSTTIIIGGANTPNGGHAFLVAKQAGTVDAGSCSIVVSGTSMTDAGVRNATDSETIVSDITTMSANDYFETSKKWIGTITYTLTPSGAATYASDFNYGTLKYEDFGNRNFKVTDFEVVGLAGANDGSFNIILYHHNLTGWTYSAAAFSPSTTEICNMNTDYNTEIDIDSGEPFAYKRAGLSTSITGSGNEGLFIKIITGAANAVEHMTARVGVSIVI